MKVWEKISQFKDTKDWDKERIAAECYAHKYCPIEIEADYHFIGDVRITKHCKFECGIECLEKYLDLEILVHDLCDM